jgi:hypothetical protein
MAQLETRSEQLTVEDNKARYDERNAYRKELASNLSELLEQDTDSNTIVSRLTELGFKVPEGEKPLEERSLDELKSLIQDGIFQLEEALNGVITVTSAVKKGVTETIKEVQSKLEQLGESRSLTTEGIMKTMEDTSVDGLKIERHEQSYQEALEAEQQILARSEIEELIDKGQNIMNNTKSEENPIVQGPWPKKIMVNGEEKPNNWRTWQRILNQRRKLNKSRKSLSILNSPSIKNEIKDKVHDHKIRIFSGAPLNDSTERDYDQDKERDGVIRKNQQDYQKELLGEGFEVEEELAMAVLMHYLKTGEELFNIDEEKAVRINARVTDGRPAGVGFVSHDLRLGGFLPGSYWFIGVPAGVSLGVPS